MTRTVLTLRRPLLALAALVLVVAAGACASSDDGASGQPSIVVTHSILGDLVEQVAGEQAEIEVLMPPGTDPHEFEPSAAQIAQLQEADLVVANGLGFEVGLQDALEAAEQDEVAVLSLGDRLDPLAADEGDGDGDGDGDEHADDEHADDEHADDEHADDEHADDEHSDDDEHEHGSEDPHWFTDPQRTALAVEAIAAGVAAETDLDVTADADAYLAELRDADAAIEEQLDAIPEEDRVLITNHEVFGYFADRYGFEVVGTVVPSGTTLAEPSSAELAELVEVLEAEQVPAIFTDSSSGSDLAEALADETGDEVEVVALFTESLGEDGSGGATYLELIRTNADRISDALS